jgi:MYND finger
MFQIKTPIMRGDKNTASVDQVLNYGLADYKAIESAILVRVPRLHAERERDNAKLILEAFQEKIGPLGNIEALLGDASRKERSCGNCDITWRKSMPRCSKCKAVSYCSRVCQEEHWTKHKKQCRKTKKPEEDTATG